MRCPRYLTLVQLTAREAIDQSAVRICPVSLRALICIIDVVFVQSIGSGSNVTTVSVPPLTEGRMTALAFNNTVRIVDDVAYVDVFFGSDFFSDSKTQKYA